MKGHPLAHVMGVHCVRDDPSVVPCLMGGSLPRSDRGDRSYFCATMLTLFKPWRSGRDLRTESIDWECAFQSHQFSEQQLKFMKNMEVKYECLDARDDFSASLRSGSVAAPFSHWHDVAEAAVDADQERELDTALDHEDDQRLAPHGHRSDAQDEKRLEVRNRLTGAGWSMPTESAATYTTQMSRVSPDIARTPSEWSKIIQSARDQVLNCVPSPLEDHTDPDHDFVPQFIPDSVKIVDRAYLHGCYEPATLRGRSQKCAIASELGLNESQTRAFFIAANHVLSRTDDQLKLFITGMAGTGKTMVLRALHAFFLARNESHRFTVIAPTGTAAALIGGSTYHSVLKVSEFNEGDAVTTVAKTRDRLKHVQYIFLDEVSMISCKDLYKISAKLTVAKDRYDLPFGGFHMIFAGDFAQLPPVIGGISSSLYGPLSGMRSDSNASQEAAIGKALWHQVLTVVILRENMRQRAQTPADCLLQTALTNMRFKKCTSADIEFLQTLIASGDRNMDVLPFRNVSVITALNIHKDEINRLGAAKFATDTGQKLISFYSFDQLSEPSRSRAQGHVKQQMVRPAALSSTLKSILWNRPASNLSNKVPGRLDLCLGMPIMIRTNVATELCITNGQEGTVAGWQADHSPDNRPILDVLYVQLTNAPRPIQLPGLPLDVVPIVNDTVYGNYCLPTGHFVPIQRHQVQVLPNFAMTDYASQGKTREVNVVDLSHCQSHQAVYTCLSRSSVVAKTLIVGQFDHTLIRGEVNGYLRQEFRHLEILDDITTMMYEGTLPFEASFDRRRTLILAYQNYFGRQHRPKQLPKCLTWHNEDLAVTIEPDSDWRVKQKGDRSLARSRPRKKNQDKQASTVHGKRKPTDLDNVPAKRPKIMSVLQGVIWDEQNWSCGYDSFVVSIYSIWQSNRNLWSFLLPTINPVYFSTMPALFNDASNNIQRLHGVRDHVRHTLHSFHPDSFPWGRSLVSVNDIWETVTLSDRVIYTKTTSCSNPSCDALEQRALVHFPILNITGRVPLSVRAWLDSKYIDDVACPSCGATSREYLLWSDLPFIIVFNTNGLPSLEIDEFIHVNQSTFRLCALTYYGEGHYTTRLVNKDGIWYHDGIETGASLVYESLLDTNIFSCRNRQVSNLVYKISNWNGQACE